MHANVRERIAAAAFFGKFIIIGQQNRSIIVMPNHDHVWYDVVRVIRRQTAKACVDRASDVILSRLLSYRG